MFLLWRLINCLHLVVNSVCLLFRAETEKQLSQMYLFLITWKNKLNTLKCKSSILFNPLKSNLKVCTFCPQILNQCNFISTCLRVETTTNKTFIDWSFRHLTAQTVFFKRVAFRRSVTWAEAWGAMATGNYKRLCGRPATNKIKHDYLAAGVPVLQPCLSSWGVDSQRLNRLILSGQTRWVWLGVFPRKAQSYKSWIILSWLYNSKWLPLHRWSGLLLCMWCSQQGFSEDSASPQTRWRQKQLSGMK